MFGCVGVWWLSAYNFEKGSQGKSLWSDTAWSLKLALAIPGKGPEVGMSLACSRHCKRACSRCRERHSRQQWGTHWKPLEGRWSFSEWDEEQPSSDSFEQRRQDPTWVLNLPVCLTSCWGGLRTGTRRYIGNYKARIQAGASDDLEWGLSSQTYFN